MTGAQGSMDSEVKWYTNYAVRQKAAFLAATFEQVQIPVGQLRRIQPRNAKIWEIIDNN